MLQRAECINSPLLMLAAVPFILQACAYRDSVAVKRIADAALKAIELYGESWHDDLRM